MGLSGLACGGDAGTDPRPAATGVPPAALVYEQVVGGNQDLYVTPATGGVERRLTDHPAVDGLPRWTPDGKAVVFTSERSGNWQIWEVAAEGGEPRRLRTNGATEWQADVSPDGTRLAFLSKIKGPEWLWIMDLRTGKARVLVKHGDGTVLGNPHWNRDGRRIVFSSNWRLPGHRSYVVDAETGEERRVSPVTSGACEPRFSPDGRKVVYVRRHHLTRERSRLIEVDLGSGEERVLVDWPALNYDPAYSPDGTEVAFASNITGEYQIYRQRFSDGKSWRVTFGKGPARYPDYRRQ